MKSKIALVLVFLLVFLVLVSTVYAAREEDTQEKKGLPSQFINSLVCIFTKCGWPAIIIFLLPPVAIYFWKKFFSWG